MEFEHFGDFCTRNHAAIWQQQAQWDQLFFFNLSSAQCHFGNTLVESSRANKNEKILIYLDCQTETNCEGILCVKFNCHLFGVIHILIRS